MPRILDIKTNVADFLKEVDQARLDQVPFAMSLAINWSINEARDGIVEEMRQVFDQPTDFTLNSPFVVPSTKKRLVAAVRIKDWGDTVGDTLSIFPGTSNKGTPAAGYLKPEIEGGNRFHKRMESSLQRAGLLPQGWYAVPAREAPLDSYGNVPPGFIIRMMSDLRAFGEQGYRANRKAGRRKGAKASNAFFAVKPGGPKQTRHLKPGIYWRLPGKMLVCVFLFVTAVQYRKRLDFYGKAEQLATEAFKKNWPAAWAQALATDRNRGKLIRISPP